MKIHRKIADLKSDLSSLRKLASISLVPTMGALHEGHISLIKEAKKSSDVVVVSIFVNPTQFDNEADLEAYPNRASEDVKILTDLGIDFLFKPAKYELYPNTPTISMDLGNMAKKLEGKYREGHFRGVALIVTKLFNIVQPDKAFFGLKDIQQYLLIKKLTGELNFPVEIIGCETVREANGLALSSRNLRLSERGKTIASNIYQSLLFAEKQLNKGLSPEKVRTQTLLKLEKQAELITEYLEIVSVETLKPIPDYTSNAKVAICFAGFVEGIRLIDNLYLRPKTGAC